MSDELDYFQITDILAHEYGWDIDYIQKLNLTEVQKLVEKINERKRNELLIQCYIINCAFVGKKPILDDNKNSLEPPKNEVEALKKLMKQIGGKIEEVKK